MKSWKYCHMQKKQLNWTTISDFIMFLFITRHLACISDVNKKTLIKSLLTVQIGWFFACGNIFFCSLGVLIFSEAWEVCMHACMHVHARTQISWGSSTRSFNYAILEQHAKNKVSRTILNKCGVFLGYAAGLSLHLCNQDSKKSW